MWRGGAHGSTLIGICTRTPQTEGICNEAVRNNPWALRHVPDQYKIQEMCDKAVEEDPGLLEYVPDWLVTQQQMKICVMTISIAVIMNFLSGTKAIKNGEPRKYK